MTSTPVRLTPDQLLALTGGDHILILCIQGYEQWSPPTDSEQAHLHATRCRKVR